MKVTKFLSWFLGISMFMFGILKLVDPFKGWYAVQIFQSGLGAMAYVSGIVGEIITGLVILLGLFMEKSITAKTLRLVLLVSFMSINIMMLVAIYVHMDPNVPAEVLPLKIKYPVIPLMFLTLSVTATLRVLKHKAY